ncbi:DUF2842 domain-containing protein [Roseomonas haemaphysalidis]|uniref:DUF2842 domain-containing protein n=1 Tax=Roseomonas haemaphysalidis TaxID=2768162 RepID=A0ABS3KQN9_9PROT|nr:DUF2842 domain-containing protein [Roseomonas haemaphysalidis]MBO1078666.1 DUF2842 domain-containing protein [Roseomonas haemaphysalidis]
MSRTLPAVLIGLLFLLLYLVLVLWLGDWVQTLHWALQVPFYVVAGFVWVLPIRALMFWAAGVRR